MGAKCSRTAFATIATIATVPRSATTTTTTTATVANQSKFATTDGTPFLFRQTVIPAIGNPSPFRQRQRRRRSRHGGEGTPFQRRRPQQQQHQQHQSRRTNQWKLHQCRGTRETDSSHRDQSQLGHETKEFDDPRSARLGLEEQLQVVQTKTRGMGRRNINGGDGTYWHAGIAFFGRRSESGSRDGSDGGNGFAANASFELRRSETLCIRRHAL
mmetsp:Transcript_4841/g.10173  ORF Transcript_4841/g.10173 Transcript_4841/m.10173 type:complete len:214 (-) Transcript_4841:22-663(-)